MNTETAYCGYDCTTCLGWIAFQIVDNKEQEEYLKIHSSVIPCAGCNATENVCEKTCGTCAIRLCGMKNGIRTCADCKDYPCILHKKN
jgi:hypothetical protein